MAASLLNLAGPTDERERDRDTEANVSQALDGCLADAMTFEEIGLQLHFHLTASIYPRCDSCARAHSYRMLLVPN